MAILQLSRITNRKGLSENLPQLAGAEFGWVLDERKLYIGNGTIEDGAPVIGNTEILTEFSDILGQAATYTYSGSAGGYIVVTGPNGSDVARSLQAVLDDAVSVKSFGAVGDGVIDDTLAINRALYELFCRPQAIGFATEQKRRSLFFPAGRYRVTNVIKVPPHAKLYGEGLSSSLLNYSPDVISVTEVVIGERYAITSIGTTTDWNAIAAGTVGTVDELFVAEAVGTGDGTIRLVVESVVETADGDQNIGIDIGTGGGDLPTGIEMLSMGIYSDEDNTLLRVDSTTNSGFHYLALHGSRTTAQLQTSGNGSAAVHIRSSVLDSQNVTISKTDCNGTTYGLLINDQVKGVVYENSGLNYHYKGCNIVANPTDVNRKPTGVVVTRNIFDNIAYQGVHFGDVDFNSSAFNVFYSVGNSFGVSPVVPVIQMDNPNCVSIGDLFARSDSDADLQPRIAFNGNGGIAFNGSYSIMLGSYERQVGVEASLPAATTDSVFVMSTATANSYKVEYNIKRDFESRMGTMYVSSNSTGAVFNEEFTESADLGVTLNAVWAGVNADSEVQFTTSAGSSATINYSIVRLD